MKVALIVGSSRGIGRAVAIKLHHEGYQVVVTYFTDAAAGRKVFKEINQEGLLLQLDGGNEASVNAAVKAVSEKYGCLDVLIISGMRDKPYGFKDTLYADWKYVLNSKLDSSFLVAKCFYLLLKKSASPQIIFNTSSVDDKPQIGALAYSVASAGVSNLAKALALELAPEGFRVNAICPGTTRTDNWIGVGLEDDDMWNRFAQTNPMGRVPTPEDVAEGVSYLVSDQAKYINGLFLYVDGGNRHRS